MFTDSDILRKETCYTKNGFKYGMNIYSCSICSKEIKLSKSGARKHCTICSNCQTTKKKASDRNGTRECQTCQIRLDLQQFTMNKNNNYTCNKCHNLRRFGINYKDYVRMLDEQNGGCAICGNCESTANVRGKTSLLAVDHNHETGKVRGLLCGKCNKAIGLLNDNPQLLQNSINYLTK